MPYASSRNPLNAATDMSSFNVMSQRCTVGGQTVAAFLAFSARAGGEPPPLRGGASAVPIFEESCIQLQLHNVRQVGR